jgi:stearoyl-CoA desaturase (delta-9 desaturase)
VADHHRHHAFSDREGDPHSPWRFGTRARDVAKGLAYAHMGWLFDRDLSNRETFAQYLMDDEDLKIIDRLFPLFVVLSLGMPAMVGGLVTWSWHGALTAFIWAGIVRVGILHHVTWSINSICHTFGEETFKTRDKSRNVWWMAILSFGESWHNLHHAKPKYARHGVDPGQIDINARIIWILEKCGRATEVRWPSQKALFESRVKAA